MREGDTIADRFLLEAEAGRGGMGIVYRARDQHDGSTVALKLMAGDAAVDLARFEREAQILSRLVHPNIVRYAAHGETKRGDVYLAMEWLEGETLASLASRRALTPGEAVTALCAAAKGLGAAHAEGIVHRDVKPANLFVVGGAFERLKVLDFGIARPLGKGATLTMTGMIIGTANYMAPEQASADAGVDARADVYSLGAVLYELLTGRPPFTSEHLMAVLAAILLEDPVDVRERAPDVPESLAVLAMRLLSKTPADRPADGRELASSLERLGGLVGGASARRTAPAITEREQRVLCLVLGAGEGIKGNATLAAGTADAAARMRAAVEDQGARLEALADGSFVARIEPRGTPTEQAVRAARCALAIRSIQAHVPLAVVAGRGMFRGPIPVGEVIDRGTALLDPIGARALPPIRVDGVIAGLLEGRYELSSDALGGILGAERREPSTGKTLLGKTAPFVGRSREMAGLEALYAECVAEPIARAALITAPAGGGKSRLLAELLDRVARSDDPPEIWIARGDPLGAGSPFALLAQMVRTAAGIQDGEPLATRRQKIVVRLSRALDDHERALHVAALLGSVARTPFEEPKRSMPPDDPRLRGDAMRDAFLTWLGAELDKRPIVIVLDDLQWGDSPSLAFADAALRELADRPLFVVAAGRPEVMDLFPDFGDEHDAQIVRLARLVPRAAEKIVRHALGARADDELVARLVDRADGNPFFLEELVRAVNEGRGEGALPATVLGMIEARLSILDASTRRVLRAASIFGRRFWRDGVIELLGGIDGAADVDTHLGVVVARELVDRSSESRLSGQVELAFRHALTREAALAMLTDDDRVLGHRLAGAWLERAGERDALVLAEHFERGAEPGRAAEWLGRAAESALEGDDLAGAVERAERGLAAAAEENRAAILVTLADAHRWRGEYRQAFARASEAAALLEAGTRPWFRALGVLFAAAGRVRKTDEAEVWRERAIAIEAPSEAVGAQVVVLCRAATIPLAEGDRARFDATMQRAEDLARARVPDDPLARAWILTLRASWALREGDHGAFVDGTEEAVRAYEAGGDARDACNQRVRLGHGYVGLGDAERAEAVLRDALAAAHRMGLPLIEAYALQNLGHALLSRGVLPAAIEAEDASIAIAQRLADPVLEAGSLLYRSEARERAGNAHDAAVDAARAVELLAPAPAFQAVARAILARALSSGGDRDGALREAEAAHRTTQEHALEEGEARVQHAYAEALEAADQPERAREVATEAARRVRERADRIKDPAWRDAFLTRVAVHARLLELARE